MKITHKICNFLLIFALMLTSYDAYSQPQIVNFNYTVLSGFANIPPKIDGVLDDNCWTLGAEFDGVQFPENQHIKNIINTNDIGRKRKSKPINNVPYPKNAGSFGVAWDNDFFYFAIHAIDSEIVAQQSVITNAGICMFFNNGNGRSTSKALKAHYPRDFDNAKDMEIFMNYIPAGGTIQYINPTILKNYGIKLMPQDYVIAVQKSAHGFVYEGKIAWKALNKEFLNSKKNTYKLTSDSLKWSASNMRPSFGLDVSINLYGKQKGVPRASMMWNQCCYNINWSRSQYFGTMKLVDKK